MQEIMEDMTQLSIERRKMSYPIDQVNALLKSLNEKQEFVLRRKAIDQMQAGCIHRSGIRCAAGRLGSQRMKEGTTMKQRMKTDRKPNKQIVNLAYTISAKNPNIWYICQRNGRGDVLVSDRDIKRFLRIGFHVESAYMNGKRYRNIYMLSGEIHFVK